MHRNRWRLAALGAALVALAAGLAAWTWPSAEPAPAASLVAATSPSDGASPASRPNADREAPRPAEADAPSPPPVPASDAAGRSSDRARDRAQWAQARRQIESALARRRGGAGPAETAPEQPAGTLDKGYIRERMRDDIVPLVQECYETLLEQAPNTGGRMVLKFAIMGDESVGGVIDAVELAEESEIHDPDFRECLTESTMSAVFDPPEGGGRVEITYPLIFEVEPDEAAPG